MRKNGEFQEGKKQGLLLFFFTLIGLTLIILFTVFIIQHSIDDNHLSSMKNEIDELKNEIDDTYFSGIETIVSTVGLNEDIQHLLSDNTTINHSQIINFLTTINNISEGSIVYVMNTTGTVLASTVYDTNKSLTGNNYAFRPYFKKAIQGNNTIYPALGVTTLQRGLYYSAPVIHKQTDSIIGVVVIKKGLEQLDNLLQAHSSPVSIISPEGVIFSTNQDDLFHSLAPLSDNILQGLNETKQYAGLNITPLNMDFHGSSLQFNGAEYLYLDYPLSITSWSLITYEPREYSISWILSSNSIYLIFSSFLCILLILCSILFYNMNNLNHTKSDLKKANKKLMNHKEILEKTVKDRTVDLEKRNIDLRMTNEKLTIAEDKLRTLNATLEQKVLNRTEEINKLLNQKDEFINQLGHDLKTPLTPLLNLLPIVESKETDPKQKEMLKVINRNVDYMKTLVTKTMTLAHLGSQDVELEKEQLNLKDEIGDILQMNSLLFDENHIDVENNLSDDLLINVDRMKFNELFNNILNNSVKYSSENGGRVSVDQLSVENGFVTIAIRDDGIGMTSDQLDRVFDEFYKADESRHDFDSSGLGMSICKRIVEMHGGRIWAESDGIGKGSTFFFTLPLSNKD